MEKYGDVEKLKVVEGAEAVVLHEHMERTGKYKVSDFSKSEKEELQTDLEAVRESVEEDDGSDT